MRLWLKTKLLCHGLFLLSNCRNLLFILRNRGFISFMFTFFKDGSQILHKNIYGVTKLARSGKILHTFQRDRWKITCFFVVLGLELTLSHSASPFCDGYFWDWILLTIFPGWLQTMIPQISASWIARITGVSHWFPATYKFYKEML
jgi:hypothetical protein